MGQENSKLKVSEE